MGCTVRKSHAIASAVCTVHENVGVVLAIVLVRNPPPPSALAGAHTCIYASALSFVSLAALAARDVLLQRCAVCCLLKCLYGTPSPCSPSATRCGL